MVNADTRSKNPRVVIADPCMARFSANSIWNIRFRTASRITVQDGNGGGHRASGVDGHQMS